MWRVAAFSVPVLLLVFAGFYAAAAWYYPGGTWEEPTRLGHSFFFNYYCDLMRPVALNGVANPIGAQLAEYGQLVLAMSFGPFFLVAPLLFLERAKLAVTVRALGVISCLAGVACVLFPSWRYGQTVHGILLLICGLPAVAALVCTMVGTWKVPLLRLLAMTLVATMLATIAIFVRQMIIGVESSPGLAPLQRTDIALALVWMTLTCKASVDRDLRTPVKVLAG